MNMQKIGSTLATTAFLFAGTATAVTLNPRGLGQALVYPYYTVNKSQDTYLSVTNASDVGKVATVRFHEGYNGRTVMDFRLFLAAHDTWTAAVSQPRTGDTASAAQITSADHSCVSPALDGPTTFLTYAFDGSLSSEPADGGPITPDRTREGYVEIVAGADIRPGSATETAITPVSASGEPGSGMPPGCAQLANVTRLADDLDIPTNGLYGWGAIIDVGRGTFYPYNADALANLIDNAIFPNGASGPDEPGLQDASSSGSPSGGAIANVLSDDGTLQSIDYARGIDAVSAVFMADTLYNDYVVGADAGANTDWIVTFPTKHFYVDQQLHPSMITAPFETAFAPLPGSTVAGSTVRVTGVPMDREGGCTPPQTELPPCFAQLYGLGFQTNAITFFEDAEAETASGVLGSVLTTNVQPFGDNGSMALHLATPDLPAHLLDGGSDLNSGAAATLSGLPVTGFMVYDIINAQAQPGLLANYSGLFPYRVSTTACAGNVSSCP